MTDSEKKKLVEQIRKRGAAAVSEWREKHPFKTLDLSKADLSGVDLSRADLLDANLIAVNFCGATLRASGCYAADFSGANLTGADLRETNLRASRLVGTDPSKARLEGASWDRRTDFPGGFDTVSAGMIRQT